MKPINASSLADMTISMLERTAMVLADPASDGDPPPKATRFARISYHGPTRGTLLLSATEGFLRELAASLLGVELNEVDVDSHGGDALKEMANIVGGSMILALSGDVCEYSLGLPELVKSPDMPGFDVAPASAECTVVAEGVPLRVQWQDSCTSKAA
jgi:CheY-specific phosphatase CheX